MTSETLEKTENILIIGSGGREYAIGLSLIKNNKGNCGASLYCCATNNNIGLINICEEIEVGDIMDFEWVYSKVKGWNIDLVFVGPEKPLAFGIVDYLQDKNIKVIGPNKKNARIESSKIFARKLMNKYNLKKYSPEYYVLDHYDEDELCYIYQKLQNKFVIKPDGLTGGKGVKIFGEHLNEYVDCDKYIFNCMKDESRILIEERLEGVEFSLFTLTNGLHCLHSPIVQDYKRLNGEGTPMTGGMATISYGNSLPPFLTKEDYKTCVMINEKVIGACHSENGSCYNGFLYGSFIKTKNGIKVIEFNCRLGDPEAINLMELLETDLIYLFKCMSNMNAFNGVYWEFRDCKSLVKYLVVPGYPTKPNNDFTLDITEDWIENQQIRWANVSLDIENVAIQPGKSRCIAVIETGTKWDTFHYIEHKVNKTISKIPKKFFWLKKIFKF